MIITCEECSTRFNLDEALIKPEGTKVRCSKCRHVFTAFPPNLSEIEIPVLPATEEQDISFEDPENRDDSFLGVSRDDDFIIDRDLGGQARDQEGAGIDFSEIEFNEPEFGQHPSEQQAETGSTDFQALDIEIEDPARKFEDGGLDFETVDFDMDEPESAPQAFEFEVMEEKISSEPAFVSAPLNADTADIEISFDQDEDKGIGLELSLDMDEPGEKVSTGDNFGPKIKDGESPGLELGDEAQADLVIEENKKESRLTLSLESENLFVDLPVQHPDDVTKEQPAFSMGEGVVSFNAIKLETDASEESDDQDDASEKSVSEPDKFAEYDKVLDQDTEPEDAGITISGPDVEDRTFQPEIPTGLEDDEIETDTDTLEDQVSFIPSPSAESVHLKRGAKDKGVSLPIKVLLVLLLLISAAYVAIIRLGLTVPVVSDIEIPFITEWLQPKSAPLPPLKPVPEEPSIDGRFVVNKSVGDLFIVTGRIKNPSNTAISYIQVKGTLMTKNNAKASVLTAYCGNIIPEEMLKSGNILDITKQLGVREGNQNTNVNIKPGATVMFMLVFSNLPEDLANFTVAVDGFAPAEP